MFTPGAQRDVQSDVFSEFYFVIQFDGVHGLVLVGAGLPCVHEVLLYVPCDIFLSKRRWVMLSKDAEKLPHQFGISLIVFSR